MIRINSILWKIEKKILRAGGFLFICIELLAILALIASQPAVAVWAAAAGFFEIIISLAISGGVDIARRCLKQIRKKPH